MNFNIYRTFHTTTAEHTLFSSTRGIFSRTAQMLGHNTSLNKIEEEQSHIKHFFDHCYSVTAEKEILPFVTSLIGLEHIMLREMRQTKKRKYCMISIIFGV